MYVCIYIYADTLTYTLYIYIYIYAIHTHTHPVSCIYITPADLTALTYAAPGSLFLRVQLRNYSEGNTEHHHLLQVAAESLVG